MQEEQGRAEGGEAGVLEGLEETVKKLDDATREKHPRRFLLRHKDVNCGAKSFAAGINFYSLTWLFIIGCVIGFVFETLFVYAQQGIWYRASGLLYGPFSQVYGMGAVLFILVLYNFRNRNNFVIFVAAMVLGLAFEYVVSWVQQMIFGSVSWDYSDMATSIGGRTNLLYGVGWGVMGLLFITHFWPWMSELIQRIPNELGRPLTIVLAVLMALNLLVSGAAVYRQGRRQAGVPATNPVAQWLDATYPDEYLARIYPNMVFVNAKANGQEEKQHGKGA